MSSSTLKTTIKVLHIRTAPIDVDPGTSMENVLAATPLAVDPCGDVYRGLARLCRKEQETSPWAVVVCVDGLGPTEMEFFSIVSRMCHDVDVYVYGGDHSTSRVAKAIELGASGEATEDVIRKLAAPPSTPVPESLVTKPHPDVSCEAPAVERSGPREASQGTPPSPGATVRSAAISRSERDASTPSERRATNSDEQGAAVSDEPETTTPTKPPVTTSIETSAPSARKTEDGKEKADDESSDGTVRVPWLRYKDGPVRTPPERRTSSSDAPAASQRVTSKASPQEPLLTEEELQALLGDDIAAIAPEDRTASGPDDRKDGGGSS